MNIEALRANEHGERVVDASVRSAAHAGDRRSTRCAPRTPAFDRCPTPKRSRRGCVALRTSDGRCRSCCGDPFDLDTQDWLEERLARPSATAWRIAQDVAAYPRAAGRARCARMDGVKRRHVRGRRRRTTARRTSRSRPSARPTARWCAWSTSTLYDAIKAGASDVHLETTASGLTIKYRIDGVLTPAETVPGTEVAEQVISRIKVMAELDIAERRVPQDGRFKARREQAGEIDFRVSVMPSVFGEDAVLRILDRRALSDQLSGLDPRRARLRRRRHRAACASCPPSPTACCW